jgi:hypothetical protein
MSRKVHLLAQDARELIGADIGYGRNEERQLRELRSQLAANGYPQAAELSLSDFEVRKSGAVDFCLPEE